MFSKEFEKSAASSAVEDDQADVTSRSRDGSSEGVHMSGAKNMMVRGRRKMARSGNQAKSGNLTSSFSDDKVQDPDRTSFQKTWYNSRYPG